METKSDEARTTSSKDARKTQIRSLPKAEQKLDQKEMKKVKGGIVGPCDRERLHR